MRKLFLQPRLSLTMLEYRHVRALLQSLQELRGDGQPIAASQGEQLALVAEAGAHHNGLKAMGLVVVVDSAHRQNTWVLLRRVPVPSGALLVPGADRRKNERVCASVCVCVVSMLRIGRRGAAFTYQSRMRPTNGDTKVALT